MCDLALMCALGWDVIAAFEGSWYSLREIACYMLRNWPKLCRNGQEEQPSEPNVA